MGERLGKLTVSEIDGRYLVCKCDCGNTKRIREDHFEGRKNKSCGCEIAAKKLWVGRKIGQLTIKDILPKRMALCVCDCGNETIVNRCNLSRKNTRSCGCTWRQRAGEAIATHGKSKTRIYRIWTNMKTRCQREAHHNYDYYGGRGVTVCDGWQDFQKFYDDMGDPPTNKHTIDRIDGNGHYEPSNCRWATMKQQNQNRRKKGTGKNSITQP